MRLVGFSAVVISLVASLSGSGAAGSDRAPARAICVAAAIEDVHLPAARRVDEIRVHVAGRSPEEGAARVGVVGGEFDRVVHVLGSATHSLSFEPPLDASSYRVTVDPVLDAPADACVDRIELRFGGRLIAQVKP